MLAAANPHLLRIGDALDICIDCAAMHPTWTATSGRDPFDCRGCGAMPVSTVPAADIASAVKFADPQLLRQQRLRLVERIAVAHDVRRAHPGGACPDSASVADPWKDTGVLRNAWLASVGAVPVTPEAYALWLHAWLQVTDHAPRAESTMSLADRQHCSTTGAAYSRKTRFWMPTLPFLADEAPRFYGTNSFDLLLLPHVSRSVLSSGVDLRETRGWGHCEVYALRRQGKLLTASTTHHARVVSYTDVLALVDNRRAMSRLRKLYTHDSLPVMAAA